MLLASASTPGLIMVRLLVVVVAQIAVLAGHLVTLVSIMAIRRLVVHPGVVDHTRGGVVMLLVVQTIGLQVNHELLGAAVVIVLHAAAVAVGAIVLAAGLLWRRKLWELGLVAEWHILLRLLGHILLLQLLLRLLTSDNHGWRLHQRRVTPPS